MKILNHNLLKYFFCFNSKKIKDVEINEKKQYNKQK